MKGLFSNHCSVGLILAMLALTGISGSLPLAAEEIPNLIESLEVGQPVYHENLTIIPVYATRSRVPADVSTLEHALARGWLEITELGGGNVPQLRVTNHSAEPIFIMGGEILSGGKQDRIVAKDVLIGPNSRQVIVPVYCTEQGRWQEQSRKFYSKSNLGTWNMRSVAQYEPSGAQYSIWGDVSSSQQRAGVRSKTSAYQESYEAPAMRDKINRHEEYFRKVPELAADTVGVIVALGREIVSVDLFADPRLFQELWPKILKSSAFTVESDQPYGQVTQEDAVRFLRQVHDATYRRRPGIDQGTELSAYNNGVNVNALVIKGSVLHLAGFPIDSSKVSTRPSSSGEQRMPVWQQFRSR